MPAECERAALRSGVLSTSALRPFCWRIWLSSMSTCCSLPAW